MNSSKFTFTQFLSYFENIEIWLHDYLISWSLLSQVIACILACSLAHILSKKTYFWLKNTPKVYFLVKSKSLNISPKMIFQLTYFIFFLWIEILIAQEIHAHREILKTVASLSTAWVIIRILSNVIKHHFWSRLVSVTLWIIATLNTLDYLFPAINLLSELGITFGEKQISLLLILKSFLAFAFLLWLVSISSKLLEKKLKSAKNLTPSQSVLFSKLSNITLYAFGVIIGLNIIGLDLSTLAIFSGALGLGVGFGLQKVFSNLISGIILLLDKSIKPGDVVVVGNTYGWVNFLGARSVSVLTRDGKEHLIPNEHLITEKVENWSYSDKKVRLHIPIAVSYKSDLHKVKELLLEAVSDHQRILKDPKPSCLIINFGPSAIEHTLRVWISDPENGSGSIKSDIYYKIWDLFKAHSIEIPFQQHDIHIKLTDKPDLIKTSTAGNHNAT